ncbi:hypothetical protein Plhal710r2_c007g0031581 [Plasmopara halstedii]
MVLKDKDGFLDDQLLEKAVQYFVQYIKAIYAGLLHALSYQLYLNTSEIIMFVRLSLLSSEFKSVQGMTPDRFIETLLQMKHGKPTDDSSILTYMPKYVWYCENTVASRDGLDKYGIKALKALYSSSHLVDDVIPTLLNGNAQSKATAQRLIIGLVTSFSQDKMHPAYVQKILTRIADHKMDNFSCDALEQYTLQYKKKFTLLEESERLRTLEHFKLSSKSKSKAPQVAPYTSKAATGTIL